MGTAPSAGRIVIVSAAMGGGHLQISHEMRRRLEQRGYAVDVVDVLDLMPSVTGRLLGASYPMLVNRAPGLYQKIYEIFFLGDQQAGERVGVPVRLMLSGLRQLLHSAHPDVVVSTYPLCTVALGHLKARQQIGCPAVSMVTTFSLNRLWVHPSIDLEMCISRDAADAAERMSGRPAFVAGPVVRPGFWRHAETPDSRSAARRSRTRRVLVSTGSLGLAGSAIEAAAAIERMDGWEAVVLCGRDDRLREQLADRPSVHAAGWVEDMPSMMASADVLVDNAGGMTAKEALVMGLPVVTFQPLAGHGRDDARAMEALGVADVAVSTDDLQKALWALDDPGLRGRRIDRGRALVVDEPLEPIERMCAQARADVLP